MIYYLIVIARCSNLDALKSRSGCLEWMSIQNCHLLHQSSGDQVWMMILGCCCPRLSVIYGSILDEVGWV